MSMVENYRKNHQHPVNRAIHSVGIPMIVAALPIFFFWPWWGLFLWSFGWGIQFFGHVIEKSSPVIFTNGASPVANMVGSVLILIAVPVLFWHWIIGLVMLVVSWLIPVLGNVLVGEKVNATNLGPLGFLWVGIAAIYWWFKKLITGTNQKKTSI